MTTYVYGNWVNDTAGGGYNTWRTRLGYDLTTTNTQVTINMGNQRTLMMTGDHLYPGYDYDHTTESGYIKIGGTTKFSSTSWFDTGTDDNVSATYNRSHTSQTVALEAKMTVNGAMSSGASSWNYPTGYFSGTSTATTTVTIPAKPSYTVSYNANNGSGAPSAQTKWYGEALTLSTTKPTRQYHKFDGWATSASGAAVYCTGTNNASNTSYTANAAVTLYAHWTRVHQPPTISSFTVIRCDANGDANDEGTCCKAKVTWSVDTAVYSSNVGNTLSIAVSGVEGTKSVNLSGTGTTTEVVYDVAELGTDSTYTVTATVTDGQSTSNSRNAILSMAFFTMDFKEGGHGVGIGKPSTVDNLLDIGMSTSIDGSLTTAHNLIIKVSDQDRDGEAPSSGQYSSDSANAALRFYDKDGSVISYLRVNRRTDKGIDWNLLAWNSNTGGTGSVYGGGLGGGVRQDGTSYYYVSNQKAFCSGVGVLPKVHSDNTNLPQCTATSNVYPIVLGDSFANNGQISWMSAAGFRNMLGLGNTTGVLPLANGGTGRSIGANRTFWCGRILYDNNTGTNGTVSLAETAANFTFMFIGFRTNESEYDGLFVRSPNGKKVTMVSCDVAATNINLKCKTMTISGTSMTTVSGSTVHASINNSAQSNSNYIYITHVVGFA